MKHILDDSSSSHFWSTSRSPFSTCYIPFQSSGSQKSNASNGAQLELKRRSYSHCKQITPSWWKNFAKCCEITLLLRSDFAAFLYSWEPQDGSQLRSPLECLRNLADTIFLLRNGSWCLPIFATDIGRYFPLDFCCLNPKILPVSHQLHDSLVFKLVKRVNIYVIISFILCTYIYLSGACSQRGVPSVTIW